MTYYILQTLTVDKKLLWTVVQAENTPNMNTENVKSKKLYITNPYFFNPLLKPSHSTLLYSVG